jgi:DUF2975 family protein
MVRGSILFLRAVIVLVAMGVLAWMLWEPQLEGRNANADQVTIYFRDPFLAYAYVGSLPFFFGLYQAFTLLGYVGQGQALSAGAVRAVRLIRYCGLLVLGFVIGAEAYIMLGVSDDRAGGVALGVVAAFACLVTVTGAAVLERVLRSGVELGARHDRTA